MTHSQEFRDSLLQATSECSAVSQGFADVLKCFVQLQKGEWGNGMAMLYTVYFIIIYVRSLIIYM